MPVWCLQQLCKSNVDWFVNYSLDAYVCVLYGDYMCVSVSVCVCVCVCVCVWVCTWESLVAIRLPSGHYYWLSRESVAEGPA